MNGYHRNALKFRWISLGHEIALNTALQKIDLRISLISSNL